MLAEIENEVLAVVRADKLAKFLADIDSLPVLDGENLVKRFAAKPPGVFFVMADFPVADRAATLKGALVCVARNAVGHNAAKKGDSKTIGLYQIMDRVMSIFEGRSTDSATWKVTGGDLMQQDAMFKAGIYVGVIRIETLAPVEIDPFIDLDALDDFQTFHADYDLVPHAGREEHSKWLQEPPNHNSSKPDLTDVVQVQQ